MLLAILVAGLGLGLWQQQRILTRLDKMAVAGPVPKAPAAGSTAQPPRAPSAVSTVNLDFSIDGAPTRGAAGASVVFLEFSDFQCPFCGRYVQDVYPRISAAYVDTGKVRYVFRHMPLESIHPNAMNAAVAASCADAQGKFWPMHDRLFANQGALALSSLLTYGAPLGLDDGRYKACLKAQEPLPRIRADHADGLRGELTGTPGFFVGRSGPDGRLHAVRRIIGAQPFSVFQMALDDVLAGR